MFALLDRVVWNTAPDSFPLWINLNECPGLWEAAVCPAGRRQIRIKVSKGCQPRPTAHLKPFFFSFLVPQ